MGFETPEEGFLAKIVIPAGSKNVPIGKLVCIIVSDSASIAAFKDFKDDGSADPPAAAPKAPTPQAPPPPSQPSAPAPAAAAPSMAPKMAPTSVGGQRIYASPLAKRLASEKGLSIQVFFIINKMFNQNIS